MALPSLNLITQYGFSVHTVGPNWAGNLLSGTTYHHHPIPKDRKAARSFLRDQPGKQMLLLTNNFSSALQAKLNFKKAIGYRTDGRSWLLDHSLKKPSNQHEVEIFFNLTKFALSRWTGSQDIDAKIPDKLVLPISESARQRVAELLMQKRITSPYWVICPFAVGNSKSGVPKRWPHWPKFIELLNTQGVICIICPGPGEAGLCAPFANSTIVLEDLSLSEYAAVMQRADKVIANDSGPMHLAASVDTPTLGIFGTTDPRRTRPWGQSYIGSDSGWPNVDDVLKAIT